MFCLFQGSSSECPDDAAAENESNDGLGLDLFNADMVGNSDDVQFCYLKEQPEEALKPWGTEEVENSGDEYMNGSAILTTIKAFVNNRVSSQSCLWHSCID